MRSLSRLDRQASYFLVKIKGGIKLYDRWHGKDDLITVQLGPHAPYTVSVKSLSRAAEAARGLGIGITLIGSDGWRWDI